MFFFPKMHIFCVCDLLFEKKKCINCRNCFVYLWMFVFRYLTYERARKRLRRSGTHVKNIKKIKKDIHKQLKEHDKYEDLRKT